MRGMYTPVTKIRRQVFAEIAKLGFEGGDYHQLDEIPYRIIPGEVALYRDSVFKERAIIGERLRLACGLPLRKMDEHAPVSSGLSESDLDTIRVERPLINVIPFACNACEEKAYFVSNACQGCLAHSCVSVCPVKAVSMVNGKSVIDKEKCLKCGRCQEACPYQAIIKMERPCAAACGVDAIESDHLGRATINQDKCVSCGQCLVNCPFAAIADKSQILQLCRALAAGKDKIVAALAPSFVGQFGPFATPERVKQALKDIGFSYVYEVAIGADIATVEEAEIFATKVGKELPFLATSCCPSWSVMAKDVIPDHADCVSMSPTPMVATARMIKKKYPECKIVFIGPCASKKLEAMRKSVRSDVDYVITFEELMGMFVAKDVSFAEEALHPMEDATGAGRGYAVAGGVAEAVARSVKQRYPDMPIQIDRAEGLRNCRKMLALAKAGKRDGYLLEGMACPGGCVGGAGTLQPINKAALQVKKFAEQAKYQVADDSPIVQRVLGLEPREE